MTDQTLAELCAAWLRTLSDPDWPGSGDCHATRSALARRYIDLGGDPELLPEDVRA